MKKNINKMIKNIDNENELQDKSEALKLETDDYKKNVIEVRRIKWWQNFRLQIILRVLVRILIIFIISFVS